MLVSVERELELDRIAILFITDDLYRVGWYPHQRDGSIYLCPKEKAPAECEVWASPTRLLVLGDPALQSSAVVERIRASRVSPDVRGLGDWIERNTFAAAILRTWREGSDRGPWNRPALKQFLSEFEGRDLVFLQIPEWIETRSGRLGADASPEIRAAGFPYVSLLDACDLTPADYLVVDRHPNARGYDKILECVGEALSLF